MFESRIKALQEALPSHEIDALLITSPYNIAYLTGIHAFSIEEREARILITSKKAYLFTDPRYTEMVKKDAPFITLIENTAKNPFLKSISTIISDEKINQLGFEENTITYKEAADLEEKLDTTEMIPTEDIVDELREIKNTDEIENIKKACLLTDEAFTYICKEIKTGQTEIEVKVLLENFIRSKGGTISFESIVAFGVNSAVPHHLSGSTKLKGNDIILLDFGAKVDGYCSDMTRTIFIGKTDEKLLKMYKTTHDAQEIALDHLRTHMKEGFEGKRAHTLADSHINANGFENIPHSLGHGVGLQVHELPWLSPFSDSKFQPGTIVTVEPGIYNPEIGGIRIEDTILITTDGIEILTKSSKEILTLSN